MKKLAYIVLSLLISVGLVGYLVYINLDNVNTLAANYSKYLGEKNPVVTGLFGMWALGVVTYLARNIPDKLWGIVKKQTTVTLTLNNYDDVYAHFLNWFYKTGRSYKSRTLVAKDKGVEKDTRFGDTTISAGYGTHYFSFKGDFFKFERKEKEAQNTTATKESIILTAIGRSQEVFYDLLKEIVPVVSPSEMTIKKYNSSDGGYWKSYSNQTIRPLNSVILPEKTKKTLLTHIDNFKASKDWYISHGIPYRTGIILHGPAGTGKSSIAKAISTYFGATLYYLSLATVTDEALEKALTSLPPQSIVLVEDIDTYNVTKNRGANIERSSDNIMDEMAPLTLSGLLNAIDGVMSAEGRILIATTNHIEKLDAALIRPGRFNISLKIDNLDNQGFKDFFTRFFPTFELDLTTFELKEAVSPAALQAAIMDNLDNPEAVLTKFTRRLNLEA